MDEQIGHYRIVKELGRGAMGVVYLAHEDSLNRAVAVKVLAPTLTGSEEDFQRFQLEARSLARLNHRNIVQIYYVGEDEGRHFFAMEYVPSSLQQMLRDQGRIESSRAAQLMLGAATGLEAAHERGIVHRDVKPANLLVAEDGTLKVADFGIARMAAASTRLTAADAILGTPRYISPEQCEGADGDPRSDIYSLGVTYYEMLSGRAPFRSTSALALVREILRDTPPPIEEVMPDVDHRTRTIVAKMMAKKPEDRYPSARELAADLQSLLLSRVMPDWDGRGSFPAAAPAPGRAAVPEPPAATATVGATVPFAASPTDAAPTPPPLPEAATRPSLEVVADSGGQEPSDAEPPAVAGGAARRRSAIPLWAAAALVLLLLAGTAAAAALWQRDAIRFALRSAGDAVERLFAGQETEPPQADDVTEETTAGAGTDRTADAITGPEAERWELPAGGVELPAVGAEPPLVEPAGRPGAAGAPAVASTAGNPASSASEAAGGKRWTRPAAAAGDEPRGGPEPVRKAPLRGAALAVWGDDPLIAGALEDYLTDRLGGAVELIGGPTMAEALVEGQPAPGQFLHAARDLGARHAVLVTSTFLREVPLEYYGHRDVVYQSRVTLESVDSVTQERITSWSGTVQYNAIQPEQALAETLADPLADLIEALRR